MPCLRTFQTPRIELPNPRQLQGIHQLVSVAFVCSAALIGGAFEKAPETEKSEKDWRCS